jgi:transposase
MSKPLTTLGDALAARGANWRAELRAAEVPRRTPPPSRPDRGYVEQPEERAEAAPITPRRRTETPLLETPVALIRFTRETETPPEPVSPSPEPPAAASPPTPEPASEPAPPPTLSPERREQLEAQLAAIQREISDMAASRKKTKGKYTVVDAATKVATVKAIVAGQMTVKEASRKLSVSQAAIAKWRARYETDGSVPAKSQSRHMAPNHDAAARRAINGPRGEAARVAREMGVTPATVHGWMHRYRKRAAKGEALDSAPRTAPVSRTVGSHGAPPSASGDDGPPLPVIRVAGVDNPAFEIHGLTAWVEHMVRLGVRAELRRRLGVED